MTRTRAENSWPTRVALACALMLLALGATVTAGWIVHAPALVQVRPDLPPMTRNVAASFMLLGAGLLVLALRGPRWIAAVCAVPVLVVSCASLSDIMLRTHFGLDQILGPSYINVQLRSPGRMAPITAVSLVVASATLLAVSTVLPLRSGLAVGLNGSVLAAFGLVAALHVNPSLAALHTGVGIGIVGAGMIALAWQSAPPAGATPFWLPLGIAAAMGGLTSALWRALLIGGYAPFAPLPGIVLSLGTAMGPILAYTVFLAQRAHAQAAALRRSEAFLQEAQALSRTGSFWWRVSTGEITCSLQLQRILEIEDGAPITVDTLAQCFEPEVFRAVRRAATDDLAIANIDCEHRLQLPGKAVKHLHLVAHGTRQKNGDVDLIGAVQDVTAQRASEEALGRLRAEFARVARITSLGALTASIAHEVQQPLAAIVMNGSTCLRMLDADPPNVAGARETARRTVRDGNRAGEVISRLRALFARKPFTREPLDLNQATREVITLCRSELQRQGVDLQAELASGPLTVAGDRVQLQQVILNLVLNATEAMALVQGRPKLLVLRTHRDGTLAQLSVRDTGAGIPPGAAERLFEAFYSTKPEGMGIGLSISRSIIDLHGGSLWAAANDGPGATFSFSVPCIATGEPHARPAAAQTVHPA